MLAFVILLLTTAPSTPESAVHRFCTRLVELKEFGVLEPKQRRALAPLLSKRLLHQLDDIRDCQADWFRQQPKDTTDKPPFVDCCLLSGTPDGAPTSFKVGASKELAPGRYEVMVDYELKNGTEVIRWHEALTVIREDGRYVIDDILFDAGDPEREGRRSEPVEGCEGKHWIW
jgi:hypothetical protein